MFELVWEYEVMSCPPCSRPSQMAPMGTENIDNMLREVAELFPGTVVMGIINDGGELL